jgi:hypothetical protein
MRMLSVLTSVHPLIKVNIYGGLSAQSEASVGFLWASHVRFTEESDA